MEEKQSVSTYNHFREVAIIEPIETVAKEGWVKWGVDNLYPQFLWSLYVNSPIHGGIINSKNTFISGAGLKYEGVENWEEINKNGRSKHTLDELVEMYSLDQEVVNGYYIRCVYDALNEIISNTNVSDDNNTDIEKDFTKIYLHDDNATKNLQNEYILVFNYKIYMINNFEKKRINNISGKFCDYVKIYILYRLVFYSLKICINLTKINDNYNGIINEYYEEIKSEIKTWNVTYIENHNLFYSIFRIFIKFFDKLKDKIYENLSINFNDENEKIETFFNRLHDKFSKLIKNINNPDDFNTANEKAKEAIKIYNTYKAFHIYTKQEYRDEIETNSIYIYIEAAKRKEDEEAAKRKEVAVIKIQKKVREVQIARKAAAEEAAAAASKMVLSIVKINLESVFSILKETKGQDVWNCPGHFGHIALATPIPHPFYKERIAKFANCTVLSFLLAANLRDNFLRNCSWYLRVRMKLH